MSTRITKWGNSLGVRIPKVLAEQAGLEEGSSVKISLADGCIIIERVALPSFRLDDFLAAVDDDNLHGEVSTGRPVGKEVW